MPWNIQQTDLWFRFGKRSGPKWMGFFVLFLVLKASTVNNVSLVCADNNCKPALWERKWINFLSTVMNIYISLQRVFLDYAFFHLDILVKVFVSVHFFKKSFELLLWNFKFILPSYSPFEYLLRFFNRLSCCLSGSSCPLCWAWNFVCSQLWTHKILYCWSSLIITDALGRD